MNTNAQEENVVSFPVEFFDVDADGLFFEYFLGDGMDTFGFKDSNNTGPTLGLVSPQLGEDGNPVYTKKAIEGAAQTIQKNLVNQKANNGLLQYPIFKQLIEKTAANGSIYNSCLKSDDGYFYDKGWSLDDSISVKKTDGQIHTGSGKVIWKHEGDGVVNMGYNDHLTKRIKVIPNTDYLLSYWRSSSNIKYQIKTLEGNIILTDKDTQFNSGNNDEVIFDIYREDSGLETVKFSIPKLTPLGDEAGENILGQNGKTFISEGWDSSNYSNGIKIDGKLQDGVVYWEQSGDGVLCSQNSSIILKTDITTNQVVNLRYYLGGNGCQAQGMKIVISDENDKVLKTLDLQDTAGFHEQSIMLSKGKGNIQVKIVGKSGSRIAALTIKPLGSELALGDYENTEEKYNAGQLNSVEDCETCMDYAYLRLKNFFNTDFYLNKKTDLYNKLVLNSKKINIDGEEQDNYEFDGGKPIEYDVSHKQFFNSPVGQNDGGFFPLDRIESERHTNDHNYHFGMKVSGNFVYKKGSKQFFNFNGDDDVYIFINGKLVVDLGGAHYAADGHIDIEKFAEENGIQNGEMCDLNMFYLERHTQASNCRIQTNLRLGYLTGYQFESVDPDKVLPDKIINLTPIDENEYYIGDNVSVDKKYNNFKRVEDTREDYDGYWVFRGWKNPQITIEKEGNLFIGQWEFIRHEYKAVYQFISGTSGKELPKDIYEYLPIDNNVYLKGDVVNSYSPIGTTYRDIINDGVWTFDNWDNDTKRVVDKDVGFLGIWKFVANQYKVTYQFISDTEGMELPQEVLDLLPDDRSGLINGDKINVSLESGETIQGDKGTWIFKGWDKTHITINGKDEEFVGVWQFVPNKSVSLVLFKVDQDENALLGAAFKVVKVVEGQEILIDEQDQGSRYEFKDLDDGIYRVYETKTPKGYEGLDTYFEIEIRDGKIYYNGVENISFTVINTNDGTEPSVLGAEYDNSQEDHELQFEDNVLGDEIDTTHQKSINSKHVVKTSDETMFVPYIMLNLCSIGLYTCMKKKKHI